ncbi:MAG: DoxX family protein [Woeseiaceae bacterium]|nr:DoxX family protein [Woeseiaceae bacterium]
MNRYEAYGPTVLRIALGIIFLAHSAYLKVFVFTIPGTVGFFESLGLPAVSAYAVMAAEIIGGTLLILGVRVRETAAVLGIVSLGATWAHFGAGWVFSNQGGGWEYPLFLAVACGVQFLLGPGAFRVRFPSEQVPA